MPLERSNPHAIDILQIPDASENLVKQVRDLVGVIRQVDETQQDWLRKTAELIRLRRGDRRPRNIPWRNASNINVPLIDGMIRRWKPGVASLLLDADPPAFFTGTSPEDFDAARDAEAFFSYLLLHYMSVTYPAVRLVDTIAWRGHAYVRETWRYTTRRQARVVPVAHLFPDGVQQTVQSLQVQAQQQGQQIPSPENIVVQFLEAEYGLSADDDAEGQQLLSVAQKILDGAEFVRLVYRMVEDDRPDWQVLDPVNVIVPQDQDPETAEFFCILHEFSRDAWSSFAHNKSLPADRVQAVLEQTRPKDDPQSDTGGSSGLRQEIRNIMNRTSGKTVEHGHESAAGRIPVWEIFANLDINGDGERERCIVWYAPNSDTIVAVLDYPYPFKEWPVTYFPFEACARPIDNRGIAEMLRPFNKLVNAYHNARVDAAQIVLAPVLLRRFVAGPNNKKLDWRPGAVIPVTRPDDVTPLVQNLNILTGLLQEEQSNQRLAETYVGVFDATLTNMTNSSERRTAAEVNAIQGLSSNIFGLDAKVFQTALSKSFNKIWALYVDLGPEELFFRVTGEEKPRLARKSEIGRHFDIRAAGTPANTNRSFQIATVERVMQSPILPVLMQNQLIDARRLFSEWVGLLDRNLATRITRSAEDSRAAQEVVNAASTLIEQRGEDAEGLTI